MLNWLLTHTPLLHLTQSLWRDEAYSILVAKRPLVFIIEKLTFEPPLYYIILHFWMKLFGTSEIAVRSLSLLGFALASVIVICWAEKLFARHWLSWFLPLFFFFNPMLLYYALEIRTYGWVILFSVLTMYAYQQKRWKLFAASATLGFYTHSFLLVLPFATVAHFLLIHRNQFFTHPKSLIKDPLVHAFFFYLLLVTPWLLRIAAEAGALKHNWYYPVDMQLVSSALGNLFLGYEGTPWYFWGYTRLLSLAILALSSLSLISKKTRARNSYFFLVMLLPLIVIIGISFFKPLYVNRYVLYVTIAEVFLLTFAIEALRSGALQKIAAAALLVFIIGFNVWYPAQHPKKDIRTTMRHVNALIQPTDIILAEHPLVFFETIYYSTDPSRVFLYNPKRKPFPWYVGDVIVSPSQMVADVPAYPSRAFIVRRDGTFYLTYQTRMATRVPSPAAPKR